MSTHARTHILLWILSLVLISTSVLAVTTQLDLVQDANYRDAYVEAGSVTGATATTVFAGDNGGGTNRRAFFDFDTSSIPAGATVTEVKLELTLDANTGNPDVNISGLSARSPTLSDVNINTECTDVSVAKQYASNSAVFDGLGSGDTRNITLNAQAITDLTTQLSADFFSVCLKNAAESPLGILNEQLKFHASESATSAFRPNLYVTYTLDSSNTTLWVDGAYQNRSVTYGTPVNVSVFTNTSATASVFRNLSGGWENVTSSMNNTAFVLGVSLWNFTGNTSGGVADSTAGYAYVNVTQATPSLTLTINGVSNAVSTTPGAVTIVASNTTSIGSTGSSASIPASLYIDGVLNNTGGTITPTFDVGTYAIKLNTTGTTNYTTNEVIYTLTVAKESSGGNSKPKTNAPPPSECSDGIDNDNDGFIDLGNDPGCSSKTDNDETNKVYACSDGIDNDGDGFIDGADPGCTDTTDDNENNFAAACSDDIDNDNDGFIDLADEGCSDAEDDNEFNEVIEEVIPLEEDGKEDDLEDIIQLECTDDLLCDTQYDELLKLFNGLNQSGKVNFNKTIRYDAERDVTVAEIFLTANENLTNLSYYQSIPSCMALYIELVNFTNYPTRVLNRDPLMVWSFETVEVGEILDFSFEVDGNIPEDCIKLLEEIFFEQTPQKPPIQWFMLIILVLALSGVAYLVYRDNE